MRRKQYIVLASSLFVFLLAISAYKYIYREHRDIGSEKADFSMSAVELKTVLAQEAIAPKYIDKVIKTHGMITAIEQQSAIIDNKVQVNFNGDVSGKLSLKNPIAIKGRCVGYDDLLELVKIDQAILVSPNN
ncbi:hypothetical protein [Poritiphilus flavus]|uniref:tRNA_anti-like n=1 Tax=Poritiphilus flavus TaxID=2697053 RepID=A0A6L9E7Z1_9FLAO|nr:hypothetical protein [Poritiphilus flavus]NAS10703.1 hypothetical protein [Poritiphilus flavus]